MAYASIHTIAGLRDIARAEATGSTIVLTHMVVGDGNGNPVTPNKTMTQLVRERYRMAINRIYQNPDDPTQFVVEGLIPQDVGGFTIREGGLIDSDGNLFTVCNLPASYKPLPSEGAFGDQVQRIIFQALNADSVELVIDPNVSIATHNWVINYATGANVFPGGTTGQILTKVSNADGDAQWHDPDNINVTVDVIEETQTLVTSQTVVDLAATTTRGLALYINGERLRRDEWTADPDVSTRLTLATSYPAGTILIAAQNEPTGSAPTPLERSKNLSDVPDKATARANLGVYSKAEADRAGPIGMPARWPTANIPTGWLIRDGSAISRTAYAALFAVLGTAYGSGDGFNTFNLPDDRALFDGNADMGRGLDTEMAVGAQLNSRNKSHVHGAYTQGAGGHNHIVRGRWNENDDGGGIAGGGGGVTREEPTTWVDDHAHGVVIQSEGGAHARPNTRAYVPIIRAY